MQSEDLPHSSGIKTETYDDNYRVVSVGRLAPLIGD